jgi:hypothetical protein
MSQPWIILSSNAPFKYSDSTALTIDCPIFMISILIGTLCINYWKSMQLDGIVPDAYASRIRY